MRQPESDSLTLRQAEITELLVRGKSTREIALELTLSPRTVETHIAAIYNKYGVSSRAELMLAVLGPSADARASAPVPLAAAAKTNLPVRRGVLVGRIPDIANIVGMLQVNQLVTVTGAGGMGKTQAAIAVGEALLEHFGGGVWLVELAALASGSSIEGALARALSMQSGSNVSLLNSLVAHLARMTLLLIIDNCEHIIGDVATLADALMRGCPQLKILATSREPLRIAGEQTYRLPSLAVPASDDFAGLRAAQAAEFAAVELFAQRARAVDFTFALDDENMPLVAQICRRLDGIPLAIELAAARVRVLPLSALAARIDSHLRILGGGNRLALPRHQTMHALIDWSYDLLAPAEQRLFERMSVFAGGAALEEAAGVNGDESGSLNLLSSLVDKSLLAVDLHASEPRYSLLQSFEQYAAEKLQSRGESTAARQHHASTYTALAERLEAEYDRAPTSAWHSRSESELENFASALDWTLAARRDVRLGQRLAAAMRPVWISAGGGRRWLQIARDLSDDRTPPLLAARLDHAAAWTEFAANDFKATLATSYGLIAVYHGLGEPVSAAYAQGLAALALVFLGRLADAEPLLTPALTLARSHGCAPLIAFLLRADSHLSGLRGDLNTSHAKLLEALAIYERIGADRNAAIIILSLAELDFEQGNVEHAFELAVKCSNFQRAHRSRHIALTLANIAAYSVALNRWDRARAYGREALDLAQESQNALNLMFALQHLAAVAALSPQGAAATSGAAASCASPSMALRRAARLLGFVDASAMQLGIVREYTEQQEYDRVLAALRANVDPDDLAHSLAQGASLTREEAIELALSI